MSDDTKMYALFEALADNVDALSDDEVLAECLKDGRSPADVATQTRSVLQDAVKAFRQRPLLEARRERERAIMRMRAASHQLPSDPQLRRDLLAAMLAQPQAQGMLTAHGREFTELTDEDVGEAILELMHLGVVPAGEKSEE